MKYFLWLVPMIFSICAIHTPPDVLVSGADVSGSILELEI